MILERRALAIQLSQIGDDSLIGLDGLAALFDITEAAARQALFRTPEKFPPRFEMGKRLRWRLGTVREWIKLADAGRQMSVEHTEMSTTTASACKQQRRGRPTKRQALLANSNSPL